MVVLQPLILAALGSPIVDAQPVIDIMLPPRQHDQRDGVRPRGGAPRVVYVNLDGADIVGGGDDSKSNSSLIASQYAQLQGPYPPYDGDRSALLQAIQADWFDFNVDITDARPSDSDYEMCMTGPHAGLGPGVGGIASLDCNDNWGNNVVFAFVGSREGAVRGATVVSQEVAHAFGLEHIDNTVDIMHPAGGYGDSSFVDSCSTIRAMGNQANLCVAQHQQHCPDGQQNSYQELLGLFGPRIVDMDVPSVVITLPEEGDVLKSDDGELAIFDVIVEADDGPGSGIEMVQLVLDGEPVTAAVDTSPPYAFLDGRLPPGTYQLVALATDLAGNVGESEAVTFSVVVGGSSGTGGDGGDDDADDGGSSGLAPGGEDTGAEQDGAGCGCRRSAPSIPAVGLLLPLLVRRCRCQASDVA